MTAQEMNDTINLELQENTAPELPTEALEAPQTAQLTLKDILTRLDRIADNTNYLEKAIAAVNDTADGNNEDGSVSSTRAKVVALTDIVRTREETNQRLIDLYMNIYADLKQKDDEMRKTMLKLLWEKSKETGDDSMLLAQMNALLRG